MTDPVDDQLREALHAEAGDAVASEEQLGSINARLARPDRRRAPWLLVAAAILLVGGVAASLLTSDGETTVDVTDGPTTTTDAAPLEPPIDGPLSPAEMTPATSIACRDGRGTDVAIYLTPDATAADVASMEQRLGADELVDTHEYLDQSATYADFVRVFAESEALVGAVSADDLPSVFLIMVTDQDAAGDVGARHGSEPGVYETFVRPCDDDGTRPNVVALVREDGWLVTVDLTTGEQRELHSVGDPRDAPDEGGPHFVDGVELSPDGEWIYFSTCCEPAPGVTFRIPVAGGEPEQVGYGAYPRVSPDGQYVAVGVSQAVSVFRTDQIDGRLGTALARLEVDRSVSSVEWSPDGTQLAAVVGRGEDQAAGGPGVGQVARLSWDGTNLALADTGKPDNPASFASFAPDGTLVVTTGGPVDDDRTRSLDVTGRWILWVDEEGVIREQAGEQSGDRTPIDGLPEALAADW